MAGASTLFHLASWLLLLLPVVVTATNATLPATRRAHHSIAILNNVLYIEGGEIATGVGNETAAVNNTLYASLPALNTSQTLDNITFQEISNHRPPAARDFALWAVDSSYSSYSSSGSSKGALYRFGGATPNNGKANDVNRALWAFLPVSFPGGGSTGMGLWDSQPAPQNSAVLQNASLTSNAQSIFCGTGAVYIGGSVTASTDVHSQLDSGDRQLSSDVLYFSAGSDGWKKSNASLTSKYTSAALRDRGQAACVRAIGSRYLYMVPTFGGFVPSDKGPPQLANMSTIHMYNPETDTWYAQTASGDIPPKRSDFCAVTAGSDSRADVFVSGGIGEDGQTLDDMYILSFPGFHWFKVPVKSTPRAHHACTSYGSSMIVSGGLAADGDWATNDVWPQSLGIFNMSTLQWQSTLTGFEASYYRYGYEPSQNITDWYTRGGMGRVRWDDDNIRLFVQNSTSYYYGDEETKRNAIIGGSVGGATFLSLLGAAAFFYRRRRRAHRTRDAEAQAKEYDSEDDDPPSPTHSELSGDGEVKEAGSDTLRSELDGNTRSELAGTARSELSSGVEGNKEKMDDASSQSTCVSCRCKSVRSFTSFKAHDDEATIQGDEEDEEDITSQWAAATAAKMSGARSIYELE
ncbi:hypothetical protein VHEMI08344 [[Torrubiella] hemipterigena]|uniref:Kelch repeat protein n=1 Tax=[Torrubiella] hemipterigena TaxID=1531966 RepID=A0A0A1TN26_9HYPO|nr:hypothetical protein VHEMI08344 [[Torrubiella] hemipterigena]